MENPEQSRKGVRNRAKRNANLNTETLDDTAVSGTSVGDVRLECQKEKIDELTKERDYLKEQLASALRREATGSIQAIPLSSNSSSDSSSESSSDDMSDSSPKTSSSDGDRKKKRKKRKEMRIKRKKYGKKSKKMEAKTCQRAQNPQQVVARYKKILRYFSKEGTMSAAFKHVGVDRNTVVVTAPIAELYIAAPVKYQELLKTHSSQVKLGVFATQCGAAILEDPAIEDTIKTFKASGKLLPLKKKK
ncbi:coiled-coil domain-containing protein 106-like [Polypterus senegalus]|uniref:coiled-coil domain-containing protein 106-like n=1 Tax=Polypterus senegalus TaxID=55291 RepID=UPI001962E3D8|nr:coiled-coil domain-containing protein 106-like [Polypterus senegalus]